MQLNQDDLPFFLDFVLLDEAWRLPSGKRQREPMNGFWMSGQLKAGMRGSDGRLRSAVCIEALRRVGGMSVGKAAAAVAVYRGGKRTAAKVQVLRVGYYECRPDTVSWDFFVGQFLHLREWALQLDEEALEHLLELYQRSFGKPRRRALAACIQRLRNDPVQRARHHSWIVERAQLGRARIESNHWDPERDWQWLATDYWETGRLQARIGETGEARSLLERALEIWKAHGHKLPHVQLRAIPGLEDEIAQLVPLKNEHVVGPSSL